MQKRDENRQAAIVAKESLLWGDNVARDYHERARSHMDRHWDDIVWPMLKRYNIDYTATADFACGRGRNTEKLRTLAKEVTMIDVNAENIIFCREYFKDDRNIRFVLCSGYTIENVEDESFTFLYTYDSMVHFDIELIIAYLPEFTRTLKKGGTLFVHHSNYTGAPGADFRKNPHWRNYMSRDLFRHLATRAGLKVVSQNVIGWGGVRGLDCLTLCVREI